MTATTLDTVGPTYYSFRVLVQATRSNKKQTLPADGQLLREKEIAVNTVSIRKEKEGGTGWYG